MIKPETIITIPSLRLSKACVAPIRMRQFIIWLSMLYAGEDIKFISQTNYDLCGRRCGKCRSDRRCTVAVSAAQAVERIGMPEAQIILSQAVIYVATAPKSNSAANAIFEAMDTCVRK